MNSDGTKLSKRQDDIRLEFFRSKGYFPEAIAALLCLVGGGFHQNADIQQTVHSLTELAKSVSGMYSSFSNQITTYKKISSN